MSSEHLERSLSLRRAGYSCGQSVLIPYAAEFGLDEELASAMALPAATKLRRVISVLLIKSSNPNAFL